MVTLQLMAAPIYYFLFLIEGVSKNLTLIAWFHVQIKFIL